MKPVCRSSEAKFDDPATRTLIKASFKLQGGWTSWLQMQMTGPKNLKRIWHLLRPTVWRTQQRLSENGFRVDGGNKSPTEWWLTANKHGRSIKIQSDGVKVLVTAEGS